MDTKAILIAQIATDIFTSPQDLGFIDLPVTDRVVVSVRMAKAILERSVDVARGGPA